MSDSLPQTFSAWLQLGQKLESENRIADAIGAYDRAITLLRTNPAARELADRRALAIAWMNRGNALQKLPAAPTVGGALRPDTSAPDASSRPELASSAPALADPLAEALRAYDEAIALFESLPYETDPQFRNHLGAAWLNRGHALLVTDDLPAAAQSFEQAVGLLQSLPLEADPFYRLNLSGAWTNLAHATLTAAPSRALEAARAALALLRDIERTHDAFAAMSLRARRAFVMAIGEVLRTAAAPAHDLAALPGEGTDAIEDGLALTREFETRGNPTLRPLAARLFRLGAQIYRFHQPQFLAEFIVETLSTAGLAADPEFRSAADTALAETLADLQRPQLFVAGTPDSDRRREIAQSLRAAQERLAAGSA